MSRTLLFNTAGSSSGSQGGRNSNHLVEFRAGKMVMRGNMVHPIKKKGLVYMHQSSDDGLMHFCWKDRENNRLEDDLILFPEDAEFKRVDKCTTGRVYVLKLKNSSRRLFFWMQEPSEENDDKICRKVNEFLNNPQSAAAAASSSRSGGSHESGGLDQLGLGAGSISDADLQSFLNGISPQELIQMLGGSGMRPTGGLASLLGAAGRGGAGAMSGERSPAQSRNSTSATPTPSPASGGSSAAGSVPSTTPASNVSANPAQPGIQLADLQTVIAGLQGPPGTSSQSQAAAGQTEIDLSSSVTMDLLQPILSNPRFMEGVRPFLPPTEAGSPPAQATDDQQNLASTVQSPQFQQALSSFSSAFQTGQLGPLMQEFGLSGECVGAAHQGDLEAFVRNLQESERKEKASKKPTGETGKEKPKEDKDDEMALD